MTFQPTSNHNKDLDALIKEILASHKVMSRYFRNATDQHKHYTADFVELKTNFANLSKDVGEISKIVRDGNGEKPLTVRVSSLEDKSKLKIKEDIEEKEKPEPSHLSGKEKVALYTTLITGFLVLLEKLLTMIFK